MYLTNELGQSLINREAAKPVWQLKLANPILTIKENIDLKF